MSPAPHPVPSPGDRGSWRILARGIARGEGPPGWKLFRPEIGIFVLGLAVFGALAILTGGILVSGGSSACTTISCAFFGSISGLCLAYLALSPRLFVVLAPEGLYYSRPLRHPVWTEWDRVIAVELGFSRNPRGSRDNYGVIVIRHEAPDGSEARLWLDAFGTEHVRLLHADIVAFHGRQTRSAERPPEATSESSPGGPPPAGR